MSALAGGESRGRWKDGLILEGRGGRTLITRPLVALPFLRRRGFVKLPCRSLQDYGLGQVSGLIDIATAQNGDVIGEQLQGHDLDDRLQ